MCIYSMWYCCIVIPHAQINKLKCETGTGQQLAQFHDRYMMIMMMNKLKTHTHAYIHTHTHTHTHVSTVHNL